MTSVGTDPVWSTQHRDSTVAAACIVNDRIYTVGVDWPFVIGKTTDVWTLQHLRDRAAFRHQQAPVVVLSISGRSEGVVVS